MENTDPAVVHSETTTRFWDRNMCHSTSQLSMGWHTST